MIHVYPGIMHIHSTHSDGALDIKSIVAVAKKRGLRWLIITDHNNLTGLELGEEGWYDDIAVIVGEEISPEYADHYLALGIQNPISPDLPPEEFIKEVNKQGGIGFIAHPDESTERKGTKKYLRWTDWDIKGFDGLEIWNHLSDWADNYDPQKAFHDYFNKNAILTGPSKPVLQWWDRLNSEKQEIVPAVGGVDAHCLTKQYMGINVKIFPYPDTFKTLTNILYLENELSGDFEEAKKQILGALKLGKSTIVNRVWNRRKKSPYFYIEDGEQKHFSGSIIKFNDNLKAVVKLPHTGTIKIIMDGQLIWQFEGKELKFKHLDRGKFRVEVFYKNNPWMFSNPICITD